MSRQTPFARAFVPWIAEWSRMGLSGTQERILLLLVSRMESDGKGRWYSWYPRVEMADALGLKEDTVRKAIVSLREKGALQTCGKSYSGKCQRYQLMPNVKGCLSVPTITKKGVPTDAEKGSPDVPKWGVSTGTPLRRKECASASSSQPSAREIYRNKDGSINPVL